MNQLSAALAAHCERRAGIEPVRIVAGFRVGDSAIEFGVDSAGVFVAGVVGRGWVEMSRKELEAIESEIHSAQSALLSLLALEAPQASKPARADSPNQP